MARLINGLRTSDLIGPRIPIVKETLDRPRPAARLGDSYGVCARTHTRVFALVEGLSRRHCRLPTCRRGTCLCLPTFPSGFQSLYGPNRPLPHALPAIGSPRRAVIGSVIESNTATIAAGIFNITDYCLSYRLSLSLSLLLYTASPPGENSLPLTKPNVSTWGYRRVLPIARR